MHINTDFFHLFYFFFHMKIIIIIFFCFYIQIQSIYIYILNEKNYACFFFNLFKVFNK